jgi:CBS domain-containing protein
MPKNLGQSKEARREVLVEDIMKTRVVTMSESATISEVARMMRRSGIGCVIVKDASNVLGIITERDIVRSLTDGHSDTDTIAEIASKPLTVIGPRDSVSEAARILADKRIKRLPVVDNQHLVGILTSTDLVRFYDKISKYTPKTIGP